MNLPAEPLGRAILVLVLGWAVLPPAGAATATPAAMRSAGFRVGEWSIALSPEKSP